MDLLQEYKELYNHEMSFCDRLNSKISNALAIITITGTGEAIVWKDCLGDGFNIVQNNGEIAGQTVFHFHMHLIPRYEGDQVGLGWKMGELTEADKEEILNKIK